MNYTKTKDNVAVKPTAQFNPDWQLFGQVLRDYDIQCNIENWAFIVDMKTGDTLLIECEGRVVVNTTDKDNGLRLFTISCWNGRDPRDIWAKFQVTLRRASEVRQMMDDGV